MKKLLLLLMIMLIIPLANAEVLESYTEDDGTDAGLMINQWLGSGFRAGLNTTGNLNVTSIAIKVYRAGTGHTLYANITYANATGVSNGTVVSTGLNPSTDGITTSGTGEWINVSMTTFETLKEGQNYTLILYTDGTSGADRLNYLVDNTAPTYPYNNHLTLNDGSTWIDQGHAGAFEINGTTVGTALEVSLDSPTEGFTTINSPIEFNATLTPTNLNLTNATLEIWYRNGTLYDSVINTVTGTQVNSTNFTSTFTGIGAFEWNVYGCAVNATATICTYKGSNRTFDFGYQINDFNFTGSVMETSNQNITLNITLSSSIETTAILYYNGTAISSTRIASGTDAEYRANLDIPITGLAIGQNKTLFWNLNLDDGSTVINLNTSAQTQNVEPIFLVACNATHTTRVLNFTVLEETNQTSLNASILANFEFWEGGGTVKKNYTFTNTSESEHQFEFCATPSTYSDTYPLKTNMQLDYEASGFVERSYFLRDSSLTNLSNNIFLYLIGTGDSQKFFGTVQNGVVVVPNAIVQISKFFVGEGVYKTIGIRETDSNGEFIEYFELDKKHRFTVIQDGDNLGTIERTMSCQTTPCTFTLQVKDALVSIFSNFYEGFASNVDYALTFDKDTNLVDLTYTDTTGLAQYVRLKVDKISAGNVSQDTICNTQLFSTSGSITCNLTGFTGDFQATASISRSPELIINYITITIQALSEALGKTGILISLIVLVMTVFVFAIHPVLGVMAIPLSLMGLKLAQLLSLTWTTITVIFILAIFLASRMQK